jgi:hypothetical protein
MSTRGLFAASVLLALAICCRPTGTEPPCDEAGWRTLVHDSFESGGLDLDVWQLTAANDFKEKVQDVVARELEDETDHALQLRANTLGTDDRTVKFLGVMFREKLDLRHRHQIEFELDWNDQENGSYLTAGIYLAPTLTPVSPEFEPSWVKFEYVGVPPGRNARGLVALRDKGLLKLLETEGWPDQQRIGRKIGRQRVRVVVDGGSVRISENGDALYRSDGSVVPFSSAYLYLQLSSHSNYGSREVFFDDIVIREGCHESGG